MNDPGTRESLTEMVEVLVLTKEQREMTPYYQDEWCQLFLGDCREILPGLPKVDLVLTDPPYGIGASEGTGKYGKLKFQEVDSQWDIIATPLDLLMLCRERSTYQIIWGMNYFTFPPTRKYLVWDKGAGFRGRDFAECELAWCSFDGNAKVFDRDPLAAGDYRYKYHPTQKPLALILWCLQQSPCFDSVADPFAGSGTTLVAAKQLGRKSIGIEIEERYCAIAADRLRHTTPSLFAPPPPKPEQLKLLENA